jgi:hypothetical protein
LQVYCGYGMDGVIECLNYILPALEVMCVAAMVKISY